MWSSDGEGAFPMASCLDGLPRIKVSPAISESIILTAHLLFKVAATPLPCSFETLWAIILYLFVLLHDY